MIENFPLMESSHFLDECTNNVLLDHIMYNQFSPFIPTTDDQSVNFSFLDENELEFDEINLILSDQLDDITGLWSGEEEENYFLHFSTSSNSDHSGLSPSSTISSIDRSSAGSAPANLQIEGMEIDHNKQLGLNNLAKAYIEAMENKEEELAEIIMKRISEKTSPTGEIKNRLLYYYTTFRQLDKQGGEYLKQESLKNLDKAFEVFYKILPYGMLAHFTANSAILKAMPYNTEVIHIVDFDMGEGAQWASLIMGLAQQQTHTSIKLTTMKWKEDNLGNPNPNYPSWRRFEETKRRLQDYSKSLGINLIMEEMEMEELVRNLKRKGGRKEWLGFNCMWAIPHMGRRRSVSQVIEFLSMAKDLTVINGGGVVTFGYGGGWEMLRTCDNNLGFLFEKSMEHYKALMESMELRVPIRVGEEARVAMECLFVGPYVGCVHGMLQNYHKELECCDLQRRLGFEGVRLSDESLMEAKQMVVREGENNLYGVRIEGQNGNEMVLEWRGIALLKVSAWR